VILAQAATARKGSLEQGSLEPLIPAQGAASGRHNSPASVGAGGACRVVGHTVPHHQRPKQETRPQQRGKAWRARLPTRHAPDAPCSRRAMLPRTGLPGGLPAGARERNGLADPRARHGPPGSILESTPQRPHCAAAREGLELSCKNRPTCRGDPRQLNAHIKRLDPSKRTSRHRPGCRRSPVAGDRSEASNRTRSGWGGRCAPDCDAKRRSLCRRLWLLR